MSQPALTLRFDQPDALIAPGEVDRGRTDLVSSWGESETAAPVLITIAGIAEGASAELELLDEPPGAQPLLTQLDADHWRLQFAAGCYGPFRLRCRAVSSGAVLASVTRRISVRSPLLGLAYPANAERSDPNATAIASVASVALTEMNEGSTNRARVDFDRAVVEKLEQLAAAVAGGGGGTPAFVHAYYSAYDASPGGTSNDSDGGWLPLANKLSQLAETAAAGITRAGSDFTFATAGVYALHIDCAYESASLDARIFFGLRATSNGNTVAQHVSVSKGIHSWASASLDALITVAAGEVVTLEYVQSTGGNVSSPLPTVGGEAARHASINLYRIG